MLFFKSNCIDLHTHSSYSDGSDSPQDLIRKAKRRGLKVISITDHDSIDSCEEASKEALKCGIEFIPGVEFSAKYRTTMHILGYFPMGGIERVKPLLDILRKNREDRNPKIIYKLNELGYPITMEDVYLQASSKENITRVHFARALVEKGYAVSLREAFHRLLGDNKPAYVCKESLSPEQVIRGIKEAGGVPILAHPILMKLTRQALKECVVELKSYGLMGIEAYYSENRPRDTKFLVKLASDLDLIATGGSDYHGLNKPGIELGKGKGKLQVPDKCVDDLKSAVSNGLLEEHYLSHVL